ncbi:hypothetical protein G5V59_23885 [Nocardioides sp. W3-2-3]|uniref:hypothetical protein n=1 Tax=Nocardioides convexus TaxID=2712224 RepID=UPI002418AA8F|nr:hypothetical protein [Nocardioides convexus]NHA01728.1 hypothetical protein [Nocardioides convexus]
MPEATEFVGDCRDRRAARGVRRSGVAAALAAVPVLGAGCAATEWPSDADPKQFCEDMTGLQTQRGRDRPGSSVSAVRRRTCPSRHGAT